MAITSRDLMKSVGLKNIKTLTRWHQSGVIPEPTIETHPGGIGRIACWPDWVLAHCRVVKQLTAEGQTLQQIADFFGDNWNEIARRYRRYKFAEAVEKIEYENKLIVLRESIDDDLAGQLGEIRQRLQATTLPPITRDVLVRAVELVRGGYNAVLVVTPQKIIVAPDFLIGLHLSVHIDDSETLLVVPLFSKIKTHLRSKELPKAPSVRPASFVYRQTNNGEVEEVIELQSEWHFRVRPTEDAPRKRKRK